MYIIFNCHIITYIIRASHIWLTRHLACHSHLLNLIAMAWYISFAHVIIDLHVVLHIINTCPIRYIRHTLKWYSITACNLHMSYLDYCISFAYVIFNYHTSFASVEFSRIYRTSFVHIMLWSCYIWLILMPLFMHVLFNLHMSFTLVMLDYHMSLAHTIFNTPCCLHMSFFHSCHIQSPHVIQSSY